MTKRLRILHLSDLHIGKERPEDGWRVERVMGEAWNRNLADIRQDGPIDLICFTGDLAQKGHAHEYARLTAVIANLLALTGCPIERFFCVPGNHDIDRSIGKDVWKKIRTGISNSAPTFSHWFAEPLPDEAQTPAGNRKKRRSRAPEGYKDVMRDKLIERQRAYRTWLAEIGLAHLDPAQSPHGRLGYRHTLDLGLGAPLHIIGFDSAWLAGDDNDARKLLLTEDQVGRLMTEGNLPLQGWSIGLIHHPLDELADGDPAKQWLADYRLGLLLHGHQHKGKIETWADPQRKLPIFAAGCLYESQNYPNGLSLVEIELREHQPLRPLRVQTRAWSANGHWHNHDGLYRDSRNGWLVLEPEPIAPFTPTPGAFVGRDDELAQLCAALLPDAQKAAPRPTVICCAIDGMPGVGKTRLAEQFITEHWLQAYPPPPDTPSGECVLRLVLTSGEDQTSVRSADALLRDLADRLKLMGPIDDIRRDLPFALQRGPGSHPRLVLIENVDSDVQAQQVADLVQRLQGCPVLVTARVRQFGGQHWKRVEVEPLLMEDAIKLLRDEAEAAGKEAYVPDDAEARHLAETLGRLPLALHIAASHLGLGKTPQEFLDELRATGLGLAPAQYGDHGLQVDRARAILRSSFDISWKAWCAGAGKSIEWQQALVALAHGPAEGVGESLGAAITDLPQAEYGPCLVAAGRLSLLEWEWAGEGDMRERRVRLHALIAEFLRTLLQPDAEIVIARMGDWLGPRLCENSSENQRTSWEQVQAETHALVFWLGRNRTITSEIFAAESPIFAIANGPYRVWLESYERWILLCEDEVILNFLLRADSLVSLYAGYPERSYDSAKKSAHIFQKNGFYSHAAIAKGMMADALRAKGLFSEALNILQEEVLSVHIEDGDVDACAAAHGKIADVLRSLGKNDEALRIYEENVLPFFVVEKFPREHAVTLAKIGQSQFELGKTKPALLNLESAIHIFEKINDQRSRIFSRGAVADIYRSEGMLEDALKIRQKEELPFVEGIGDFVATAVCYGKIADIYEELEKYGEAISIRRIYEIPVYEKYENFRLLPVGRTNLALALFRRGRCEDRSEIKQLLSQALSDAERFRLLDVEVIRGLIAQIFGDDDEGELPS